ncbi:MAG: hypothetical protein Kow0069_17530 [Promethearchaeota archaeon]
MLFLDDDVGGAARLKSNVEKRLHLVPLLSELEGRRAARGEPVPLEVVRASTLPPGESYFATHAGSPLRSRLHPNLLGESTLGGGRVLHEVVAEFEWDASVTPLTGANHTLFDLVQDRDEVPSVRVNYHAVCVTRGDPANATFWHVTDLHVAKRNDVILSEVLKELRGSSSERAQEFVDKLRRTKGVPLEERFVNINDNLRRFVTRSNEAARRGQLDLVFATGDLVDYCIPSDGGSSVTDFRYENTNWVKLHDLLLGRDGMPPESSESGEELLVPLVTTVGNHDYRAYHYSIQWGGLFRLVGLRFLEALCYKDSVPATPVTALVHGPKCLSGYWREFSPFADHAFQWGDSVAFFSLDTGKDSFLAFRDLLLGGPALDGLSDRQVDWLHWNLSALGSVPPQVFVFMHAPAVNVAPRSKAWEKLRAFFARKKTPVKELVEEHLKESYLRSAGLQDPRVDALVDCKHGTITKNWDAFLAFAWETRAVVLAGHTHRVKEFRGAAAEQKTSTLTAVPFVPTKVENPLALYFDDYSSRRPPPTPAWLEENKPFFLQTNACGPNSYRGKRPGGGFRELQCRGGRLASFGIRTLQE